MPGNAFGNLRKISTVVMLCLATDASVNLVLTKFFQSVFLELVVTAFQILVDFMVKELNVLTQSMATGVKFCVDVIVQLSGSSSQKSCYCYT